ncbi:MAG: hypothetical protein VYB65_03465 [Myxococcota bacterium]|nr:hypothetical protein [Myxococcota bacterium]
MMKAWRLGALTLLGVTLACAAPQDGEGQGAVDAGAAAADAGVVAADAGAQPVEDAGPIEPQNKCLNEADEAALDGTFGEANETASEVAKRCGLACFQQQGISVTNECVVDCMRGETDGAVTDECLSCFGVSVICTTQNCALVCAADPNSDGCIACQCGGNTRGVNCFDAYSNCSGRPATATCP